MHNDSTPPDAPSAPAHRHVARWALLVVAVGLGVALGTTLAPSPSPPGTTMASAATVVPPAGALALQNAFVHALQAATPSVVEISTSTGLGSGVVYDAKGDVVTNAHVVGTSTTFTVRLSNGRRVAGTLVGVFAPDDLAVIRLASTAGLRPASFANSSRLQVGDLTLAIGSPLGLSGSVTDGIVSSTGRAVSEGNGVVLPDTIQTSAAINPGNSGGALVDLSGQVIGIPTLAAASGTTGAEAVGIGFAIPSNTVRLIAPQLIAKGKVTSAGRAALGIAGQGVVSSDGTPLGVYVAAVTPGGPAAKAGIAVGGIIESVASRPTPDFTELATVLATLTPGAKVPVKVLLPSGDERTVTVTLGDLAGG
jgi:S1-C subfamily serine protease